MKLIGKLDDNLVYEVDRGQYIVVNPDSDRWTVEWLWYGQLGKWCDRFTKCGEDENDEKCLEIIENNKDEIRKQLNRAYESVDSDVGKEFLDEQDEFYDWLDENREYDWNFGYVDQIAEDE